MNRKKILIVDDDAVILNRLSRTLKAGGYDVLTAPDGGDAVSASRRERPDLILLDITFPPDVAHGGGVPWDAFTIIEWLRRLDETKSIPIIIITSSDPDKYKQRAMAAGVVSLFRKPIENDELLVMIRKTLGEDSPANSPPAA